MSINSRSNRKKISRHVAKKKKTTEKSRKFSKNIHKKAFSYEIETNHNAHVAERETTIIILARIFGSDLDRRRREARLFFILKRATHVITAQRKVGNVLGALVNWP